MPSAHSTAPRVQVACERCSVGVMDSTNPHLLGTCSCPCHAEAPRPTEWTAQRESGWTIPDGASEPVLWEGLRILWRFKGERRWRRQLVVADRDKGQTTADLVAAAEEIVAELARRVS